MNFRQFLEAKKMAGFDPVEGIVSIKRSPDFAYDGTYLVTLTNGDVHPIFYDRQSGAYWHGNHISHSDYRGMLGTMKGDVLPNLIKQVHELTPGYKVRGYE